MSAYSSFKAAWHMDRIAQLRDGKDIVPTHVQLILSDLCNQDCHFCAYRMEGGFSSQNFADADGNRNPNRMVPAMKAVEIIEDCARLGVKAMQFTGGGEPTVHPEWVRLIGLAQQRGMQTGLVTNGVRLGMADDELLSRLTWVRVSLDAGRPDTYERVRRSKSWHRVMGQLERLGRAKGPYVGLGFVVTRENYLELSECCEIARDYGIAYVRISAMFSSKGSGYYFGIEDEIHRQIAKAKAMQTGNFKVVDFFDNRIADLNAGRPDYDFCGYQQFTLYIGGDQKVYTCCTNAYTTHGEIGDLKEQSFAQWLATHRRYDYDPKGCHDCQFNQQNRVINFLLEKSPAHVDFV